ncbi:response regulator transcription factor [Dongia sp.]|uniref:response regulator transcription factor n=1 Tax=Dongia sp. TaxID=1977262 RepID=UPI0037509EC3
MAEAKTVMVVDADILARMAIADYLRDCGYKVIEGASGADAHTVLAHGHPVDVLLIDMQLQSSEDGFELARAIRADYPQIAVIHTSSAAKLADKAADLCDDGPLIKPYHPQELLRRIRALRQRGDY